jgi:ABC-type nickel/cobalt efflux system permease component RcnA
MSLVAPYVPVLVVLAVTAIELLRGRHIDPVGWIMALVLVLLVLGREVLRFWDQTGVARLQHHRIQAAHVVSHSRDPNTDAVFLGR